MNPEPTTQAKKAAEPMTPQQKAHLREYWRNIGGSFHGPATIPEERLLPLLDELHQARKVLSSDAAELARLRGEVTENHRMWEHWQTEAVKAQGEVYRLRACYNAMNLAIEQRDRLTAELADAKRERDAGNKALAFIKDRVRDDEDFDADEIVKVIEERIGRYSQSLEWFAPKALQEELADARDSITALTTANVALREALEEATEDAIEAVESLQAFGTPGRIIGARCRWCKHDCLTGEELVHDLYCPYPKSTAALAAAQADSARWQPIETAPKDGTRILAVNCAMPRHMSLTFWIGAPHNNWRDNIGFTHWQPLPAPLAMKPTP